MGDMKLLSIYRNPPGIAIKSFCRLIERLTRILSLCNESLWSNIMDQMEQTEECVLCHLEMWIVYNCYLSYFNISVFLLLFITVITFNVNRLHLGWRTFQNTFELNWNLSNVTLNVLLPISTYGLLSFVIWINEEQIINVIQISLRYVYERVKSSLGEHIELYHLNYWFVCSLFFRKK